MQPTQQEFINNKQYTLRGALTERGLEISLILKVEEDMKQQKYTGILQSIQEDSPIRKYCHNLEQMVVLMQCEEYVKIDDYTKNVIVQETVFNPIKKMKVSTKLIEIPMRRVVEQVENHIESIYKNCQEKDKRLRQHQITSYFFIISSELMDLKKARQKDQQQTQKNASIFSKKQMEQLKQYVGEFKQNKNYFKDEFIKIKQSIQKQILISSKQRSQQIIKDMNQKILILKQDLKKGLTQNNDTIFAQMQSSVQNDIKQQIQGLNKQIAKRIKQVQQKNQAWTFQECLKVSKGIEDFRKQIALQRESQLVQQEKRMLNSAASWVHQNHPDIKQMSFSNNQITNKKYRTFGSNDMYVVGAKTLRQQHSFTICFTQIQNTVCFGICNQQFFESIKKNSRSYGGSYSGLRFTFSSKGDIVKGNQIQKFQKGYKVGDKIKLTCNLDTKVVSIAINNFLEISTEWKSIQKSRNWYPYVYLRADDSFCIL